LTEGLGIAAGAGASAPFFSMKRVTALASDNQNPDFIWRYGSIDHRVREVAERVYPASVTRGSTKLWILDKKSRDSIELIQEPGGKLGSAFSSVEASGFKQVSLCTTVQRIGHAT
jgi:hypothetical protein